MYDLAYDSTDIVADLVAHAAVLRDPARTADAPPEGERQPGLIDEPNARVTAHLNWGWGWGWGRGWGLWLGLRLGLGLWLALGLGLGVMFRVRVRVGWGWLGLGLGLG